MNVMTVGRGPQRVRVPVKSAEASATIPRGTPVCLVMNGTDDGFAVVLPATGGAAKANLFNYGVVIDAIAPKEETDSIVYGLVPYALVTRATRAASSDSWTSSASVAVGVMLAVDTINNAFLLGASAGSSNFLPQGGLAQSIASMAASATATTDTRTAITAGVRIFVRQL